VLGCGVNIGWHPPAAAVSYPATSLVAAAQHPIDRVALAQALLRALDSGYAALRAGHHDALRARWRALLHTLGRSVRVELPSGSLHGVAEDVTPDGLLLVRDMQGNLHRVASGDVSLR
jgi:BirA family transcriptional regulator, biotin operon repressor / biotin---[acetyl-CoA-carboxylase] ligase